MPADHGAAAGVQDTGGVLLLLLLQASKADAAAAEAAAAAQVVGRLPHDHHLRVQLVLILILTQECVCRVVRGAQQHGGQRQHQLLPQAAHGHAVDCARRASGTWCVRRGARGENNS
jgi:hypothetical protein